MGDAVFGFGKHKGRTFQEVLGSEPGYVRWVLDLPNTNGQMKEFVEFCKSSSAQPGTAGPAASSSTGAGRKPPASGQIQGVLPQGTGDQQVVAAVPLSLDLCGDGQFALVGQSFLPPPIWRELSSLPEGVNGPSRREWRFPLSAYESVMQQLTTNPILSPCEAEPLPSWLLGALKIAPTSCSEDPELQAKLQEYLAQLPPEVAQERPVMQFQKDGIVFGLSRGGRCLLGDEMGLGKTLQALAIIAQYTSDWPALVIAPSALRMVWRDQALAWLPHLLKPDDVQVLAQGKQKVSETAKILITSYDLLARNARFQARSDGEAYQAIIVDEAHFIKDPKSKRTGVVLQLCSRARRCVLISGTPAVNRAAELYTLLQVLLPEVPSYTRYCERYCEREERFLPRGPKIVKWVGAKRKSELNALLTNTIMIRRLKKDVLTQLPKKRRQRITLASSKLDSTNMKEIGQFLDADISFEDGGVQDDISQIFKKTAEAKVDAVAEYAEYLLSNDVKFLLFAHHHVMLDGLENKLKALSARYIRIDGKTPQGQRAGLVQQFQQDEAVRVALLSITACGQGLTLTAAHTVVFAELYWVVGQMMQAEDRVHRIGQTEMVDVHYCIAEGSLDGRVFGCLNKKSRVTSGILDGEERCLNAWKQTDAPSNTSASCELGLNEETGEVDGSPAKKARVATGLCKYFKSKRSDPGSVDIVGET